MAIPLGSRILGVLTLATGILLVLFILFLLYSRKALKKEQPAVFVKAVWQFVRKNSIFWAWLFAIVSTLGSLYYSEVLEYNPCKLCWFQRILMYPFVLLLGIAWYKDDFRFSRYAVPMAVLGALIAAYHYMTQRLAAIAQLAACATAGETSCLTPYTFQFGYITIPMMALTAFIWIALLMYVGKKTNL